jgi:hypothetical protein
MHFHDRARRLVFAFLAVALGASAGAGEQPAAALDGVRLPELNWTQRSDWINVRAAGAKGDGATDDTDAIQRVLDRLADKPPGGLARGHVAYFPPGRYRITRTLTITQSTGGWLIGHGRATTISWDGEAGGRMYWSNGCRYVCYEGLTWDGQGKAAILVGHQSQSYYETWVRYLHCAFLNSRDYGVVVGLGDCKSPSAEIWFRNCLFDNCGEGTSLLAPNDYDNIFDGCEFNRCGIGIHAIRGNWQVRGCRFRESRVSDVKQDDISHAASLRFCVSSGSRRFLETCRSANPMPMQIEGCRVDGWTASDGAIVVGHPGPFTIFDCVFSNPTGSGPAVAMAAPSDVPQSLIESANLVPPGVMAVKLGARTSLTEIPAGRREPVLPRPGQQFLQDQARTPGKVFDAQIDFGAKGDGKADDTAALQHCIDAAREWAKDAIAYFPSGDYRISRTLTVGGADYFVGGMGTATRLFWSGEAGGVAVHVDTPRHVVIENFVFGPKNDSYTRIRQTAAGASSVLYDQVEVNHWNEDPPDGLLCDDLPDTAQVRFGLFNGKLKLHDCGQADIFALIHYGPATLDGAERPKTGFTGLMFHNAALPSYALTVSDNQDLVVGDYYMEQSTHYLLCEGGNRPGTGHVTLGASKISSKDVEAVTLRDYEGRIWIGGGDAQCDVDLLKPLHLKQQGTRPLWFFSAGNSWCEYEPILDFGNNVRFVRLGDVLRGKHRGPLPNQVPADALLQAAAALDDFRHLGSVYLNTIAGAGY